MNLNRPSRSIFSRKPSKRKPVSSELVDDQRFAVDNEPTWSRPVPVDRTQTPEIPEGVLRLMTVSEREAARNSFQHLAYNDQALVDRTVATTTRATEVSNPATVSDPELTTEKLEKLRQEDKILVNKMVAGAKQFRVIVMAMRAEPPEYIDNHMPLYESLLLYKEKADKILASGQGGLANKELTEETHEIYLDKMRAVSERLGKHLLRFSQYREELHPPLPTCTDSCPFRQVLRTDVAELEVNQNGSPYPLAQAEPDRTPQEPKSEKSLKSPYEPLRPWQTRLLKLERRDPTESRLSCQLFSVEFIDMPGVGVTGSSDMVTYTALSYSWGNDAWTDHILCNGIALPIPKALAEFLCRMRELDKIPYLWCDAICINQGDDAEKALQVRNMLRIFEKAHEVIGWIGEPQKIELSLLSTLFRYGDYAVPGVFDATHDQVCTVALQKLQEQVWRLSEKPWFSRTWVRQELFAASVLTVRLGQSTCGYIEFLSTLSHWLNIKVNQSGGKIYIQPQLFAKGLRTFGINESFCVLTEHFQHKGVTQIGYRPPSTLIPYTCHWLRVLQEGVDFDVTDDRDRVYGVLGIIQSPTTRFYVEDGIEIRNTTFPLSYSKSVSEVYQDVMKYLINVEHNLDVLATFQDRRKVSKDLPSWAIDWRIRTKRSFIPSVPSQLTNKRMRYQTSPQDFADVGKLRLQGFSPWERIGMIRYLTDQDRELSFLPGWQSQSGPDQLYSQVTEHDSNMREILFGGAYVMSQLVLYDREAIRNVKATINTGSKSNNTTTENQTGQSNAKEVPISMFVPRHAMLDDIVVRFKGSIGLHIVRESEEAGEYTLIGPVWVSAPATPIYVDQWEETLVMDGEGAPDWPRHIWHDYTLV